jgi:hypothetical protein
VSYPVHEDGSVISAQIDTAYVYGVLINEVLSYRRRTMGFHLYNQRRVCEAPERRGAETRSAETNVKVVQRISTASMG